MKVIMSHPYSSALFWWFAHLERSSVANPDIKHPYYRALFRNSEKNLDLALTCAVVFEEFVIPAIDAPFPGSGFSGHGKVEGLGLTAEWDPVMAATSLSRAYGPEILSDIEISALMEGVPESERSIELTYALSDAIFADRHAAPVISSPGRALLVSKLVELGFLDKEISRSNYETMSRLNAGLTASSELEYFNSLTGFSFKRDSIERISSVRNDEAIASYGKDFQQALIGDDNELMESAIKAFKASQRLQAVNSAFTMVGRTLSYASLVPVVGTAAGLGSIAADGAATFAKRKKKAASWFELPSQIKRYQDIESLIEEQERLDRPDEI